MRLMLMIAGVGVFLSLAVASHATTVQRVVLKASDSSSPTGTVVDPYLDWINSVGVNEGVAGANSLTNNGIDFKDSWVDSNWGSVESARVSMYSAGVEVAFMEFMTAGTSKSNFFSLGNLTSSSWGTTGFPGQDLLNPYGSGQWFSTAGAVSNDRHWYVNNNWGGCGVDRGWFVVLDGTASPGYVCSWEDNGVAALGSNTRGFMYSTLFGGSPSHQNFNSSTIGIADTFAISVTYEVAVIPLPASAALLLSAFGGLALIRRRRARQT